MLAKATDILRTNSLLKGLSCSKVLNVSISNLKDFAN
jgi:hypothetical protein